MRAPGARVVIRLPATLRDFFRQRVRIEMGEGPARARSIRTSSGAARRSPDRQRSCAHSARRTCSGWARISRSGARRTRWRGGGTSAGGRRTSWPQAGSTKRWDRHVKVLCLVTRLPVPPWRGDQVRAYHHLRRLAPRHDITCCALLAREPPAALRDEVAALGVRLEVVTLGSVGAVPALARAVVGDRRPFQVLLYARGPARRRVAALIAAGGFDVVHAQLVRTAPYLPGPEGPPVVLDLIDALSANLARRARQERGPLAPVAAWEATRLARFERELIERTARSLVVSAAEREALGGGARIAVVPNGVDTDAFAYHDGPRPPARLVFFGNLGYFPNVDAVRWLVAEIFPRVRATVPAAELRLVGARPARAVRALARAPGVSLAAGVPAMAPEVAGGHGGAGPDARRDRSPEQGARGDGGRHARGRDAAGDRRRSTCDPESTSWWPTTRPGWRRPTVALLRDPARARAMARRGPRAGRATLSLGGLGGAASRRRGTRQCAAGTARRRARALHTLRAFDISPSVHRRDRGWRVRWAVLVAGDMLAACLAYLLAFILRVVVPFPLTQGYLPAVRFARGAAITGRRCWLAQVGALYFLGLYETRAVLRPRDAPRAASSPRPRSRRSS